ncbi:ADC synthase [Leptodontidium sp. MPI-SDFR-AT-0119]|nr:ADC synthase [Leptodontidium sp. MPI-SDFR-AT-0119]
MAPANPILNCSQATHNIPSGSEDPLEKLVISPVTGTLSDIARRFIEENEGRLVKIHGYVGFNYAAHIRGQSCTHGEWPLLCLMVPRTEVIIHAITDLLDSKSTFASQSPITMDSEKGTVKYSSLVAKAVAEIKSGKYTKIIISRAVDLTDELDMPATLLRGRRGNNPARSFSFNHERFQATGFSPELPLAGTRSRLGTDEEIAICRHDLLNDPKEIIEHVVSVMAAIDELKKFCDKPSVIVEELMAVRDCGSVQHLGSRVSGKLAEDKDGFDAFNVLFPAITASGIPKALVLDATHLLEDRPRELYSGAVLIDGMDTFEGTLVLRTVSQHGKKGWIQAGAGIIDQSTPERELTELTETCGKLASIAPYL